MSHTPACPLLPGSKERKGWSKTSVFPMNLSLIDRFSSFETSGFHDVQWIPERESQHARPNRPKAAVTTYLGTVYTTWDMFLWLCGSFRPSRPRNQTIRKADYNVDQAMVYWKEPGNQIPCKLTIQTKNQKVNPCLCHNVVLFLVLRAH